MLLGALIAPGWAENQKKPEASRKGAYITVGAGGGWAGSPSASEELSRVIDGNDVFVSTSGTVGLGGGVGFEGGIGYDFDNKIRVEATYVRGNYLVKNTVFSGSVSINGVSTGLNGVENPLGSLSTNSVLVSGYYDFQSKSRFTPYAGIGIGYTSVNLPTMQSTAVINGVAFNGSTVTGANASAFGYQVKIGLSYRASNPADIFAEAIYQGNTGVYLDSLTYGNVSPLSTIALRALSLIHI